MPGEGFRAQRHQERSSNLEPSASPAIGVHFICSNQYLRVFRNLEGTHYLARCPKCAKTIRFRVEQGGSNRRFFEVSC